MQDRNDRCRSSSTSSSHVSWTHYILCDNEDDDGGVHCTRRLQLTVPRAQRIAEGKQVRTQQCKQMKDKEKKEKDGMSTVTQDTN